MKAATPSFSFQALGRMSIAQARMPPQIEQVAAKYGLQAPYH